jgi:hypothetical protein
MSIDSFFFVPRGTRNQPLGERSYKKYKRYSEFVAAHGDDFTHQVYWLAGGWIDEQYFFEEAEDARWFYGKGWKSRDFLDGDGFPYGHAPTALWIDDQEVEGADNNLPLSVDEAAKEEAFIKAAEKRDDEDTKDTFGIEEAASNE